MALKCKWGLVKSKIARITASSVSVPVMVLISWILQPVSKKAVRMDLLQESVFPFRQQRKSRNRIQFIKNVLDLCND